RNSIITATNTLLTVEEIMGESRVKLADSQEEVQRFMKYVLKDLRAMDRMLDEGGWFETEPIRIGAEQELCLVDRQTKAWPQAMESLDELQRNGAEGFTTDRKSTRLNSSHVSISYAVFCLKKKINCRQTSSYRLRNR